MPRYKNVNGVDVELTPEEISQIESDEADWAAGADARVAAKVQSDRRNAYKEEADELFFQEQAGEISSGTHAAKRTEIKQRFPKD